MSEYHVKSIDTKHFYLTTIDEKPIGILKYDNWFSFKSEIILEDNSVYYVQPKGFWGTTIELKKDEIVLLNFKMNWNGNIVIGTKFEDIERDFIFKHKGILKSSYVLQDKDGLELLVIQPDFKWKKFRYDYTLSTAEELEQFDFKNILLLTTIHCANYYIAMMSSSG
jgi:hypothetical protein